MGCGDIRPALDYYGEIMIYGIHFQQSPAPINMSRQACLTARGLFVFAFCLLPCLIEGECPKIKSRREWNAAKPTEIKALSIDPPPYVVVHHSETPECLTQEACKSRIRNIQYYHMITRGWEDIGYNFLIGGDGNIYEGRGWGVHGAHVVKYNARSVGICLIGNFKKVKPKTIQLKALKSLIGCGVEIKNITSDYHLIGHRQGVDTSCPGDKLFQIIETWPHFDRNPGKKV